MDPKAPSTLDEVVVRDTPASVATWVAAPDEQVDGGATPSSTGIEFVDSAPGAAAQVGRGPEMVRETDEPCKAPPGPRTRRASRWPGLALFVFAGLYCLYLAAFHAWAGSGPPSPGLAPGFLPWYEIAMAETVAKLSVSIPTELAKAVRRRVGPRGLSGFVAMAISHELEREQLGTFLGELEEAAGSVSDHELARARRAWPKR